MRMKREWLIVCFLVCILAPVCMAIGADNAAAQAAQGLSLGEIIRISGWPIYLLMAASFAAVALVAYFFFVLRREQVLPAALSDQLPASVASGSLDSVIELCRKHPSPLAAVIMSGAEHMKEIPRSETQLIAGVIEAEGRRQAEIMQGQTRYLMDIAAVSPMIGLLGTVLGMVRAFRGVALDEAMARPVVLADGIQQALYTTAAGLLIAIPAMIFYAFFRERAAKLLSELEARAAVFMTAIAGRRSE